MCYAETRNFYQKSSIYIVVGFIFMNELWYSNYFLGAETLFAHKFQCRKVRLAIFGYFKASCIHHLQKISNLNYCIISEDHFYAIYILWFMGLVYPALKVDSSGITILLFGPLPKLIEPKVMDPHPEVRLASAVP